MTMESIELALPGGQELYVRAFGEGPAATVLVHGWSLSGRIWDEVIARWPAHLGRLYAPDLRGAGWSGKPASGYQLEQYAADVRALIAQLISQGATHVKLVGHSMGGAIAQLVALDRELALDRVVLVCPVPASGVPLPPEALGFFRAGAAKRSGARAVLASAMAQKLSDEAMERVLDGAATVRAEAYLEGLDAWRNASFSDRIGAINTRVVVIGGEAEPYLPPAFLHEAVVSKIPGATFVGVAGAGHYPMVETPDAFAQALFAALA